MLEPHAILTNPNTHPACMPGSAALRGNWDRTTPFDADAYVDRIVRQHERGKGTSRFVILDNLFYEGPHEPSIMDDEKGLTYWYKTTHAIIRRIMDELGPELLILEDPKTGKRRKLLRDHRMLDAIYDGTVASSVNRSDWPSVTGFGVYHGMYCPVRLFGGPMAYRDLANFMQNVQLAESAQPRQRFIPWIPYVGYVNQPSGITFTRELVTAAAACAYGAGARQVIAWYPRKRYAAQHWYETMQAIRDGGFAVPIDWEWDSVKGGA